MLIDGNKFHQSLLMFEDQTGFDICCEIISFHGHKISWFDDNGLICGHLN